jgi:molybdopterin-guanine dinucleotide biosynthesis protein A
MGRDKARLPHPATGAPLLAHQLATLRAALMAEACCVLSVRAGGDSYNDLVPAIWPRVQDEGTCGPLGALAALATSTALPTATTHLLVLAVDLPWMTAAALRALSATITTRAGAVWRHDDGTCEPLAAIYPRATLATAHEALAKGAYSLQPLLQTALNEGWMQAQPLNYELKSLLANWNTPNDSAHPKI